MALVIDLTTGMVCNSECPPESAETLASVHPDEAWPELALELVETTPHKPATDPLSLTGDLDIAAFLNKMSRS